MSGFKRKEAVPAGARRIVCAELESAIQALSRQGKREASAAAHDALARASAGLELAAPLLPRDAVRQDRKRLAQVRQTLDQARHGRRLTQRLDKLLKPTKLDPSAAEVKAFRKSLMTGSRGSVALQSRGRRFDPLVYRLVAELAELRGRVGHWADADPADKPDASPPGLAVCYRKARTAADRAADPPEALDAAEAALSQLVEALTLVAKACPALIKPQRALVADAAEALDRLALDAALAESAEALDAKDPLRLALQKAHKASRADAQQRVAQARAYALAETPPAFARRVGSYWQAWRGSA